MERLLEGLDPNTTYDVEVGFDFATEDWGTVNLWTLFVDVDPDSPTSWTDFEGDAFQTDTGNGAIQDVGYVWETKTAAFTEETDAEGRLHRWGRGRRDGVVAASRRSRAAPVAASLPRSYLLHATIPRGLRRTVPLALPWSKCAQEERMNPYAIEARRRGRR